MQKEASGSFYTSKEPPSSDNGSKFIYPKSFIFSIQKKLLEQDDKLIFKFWNHTCPRLLLERWIACLYIRCSIYIGKEMKIFCFVIQMTVYSYINRIKYVATLDIQLLTLKVSFKNSWIGWKLWKMNLLYRQKL